MSDLWGAAGGTQEATRDSDAHAVAQLGLAEGRQGMALRDLQIQDEGIKVTQARMTLERQQKFNEALTARLAQQKQGSQSQDPSQRMEAQVDQTRGMVTNLADQMSEFADLAIQSGLPEQGKEYARTASTLRKNQAETDSKLMEQREKAHKLLDQLLPGVHDEASWRRANAMFMMETGIPSPYAHQPYDPQFVGQLKSTMQTLKEKAETAKAAAQAREADARTKESGTRIGLVKAQEKLAQDRDSNLIKSGGKNLIPTEQELKSITDQVLRDYAVDATDANEIASVRVQARPIAERMKQILAQHPGMARSAAAKQAYGEFESKGEFGGLQRRDVSARQSTQKNPATLPKDKTGLQDNTWYTVNGATRLFVNGKFWTQEELNALGQTTADKDDKEDDDNEDEE